MKDFWLVHSGRHCRTIDNVAALRPRGYSSWRLGNLLGTAFQDNHRLAVNLGSAPGELEITVADPTTHAITIAATLFPWSPPGDTDVYFYVDRAETLFLFSYVDPKYQVLIQEYDLGCDEWEHHRPTLANQISDRPPTETSRRIKIATSEGGDIFEPTQDDEGGGYLP